MKRTVIAIVLCLCCLVGAIAQEIEREFPEIKAVGKGVPPSHIDNPAQAKLMAGRAAEVEAMRNLLQKIEKIIPEIKNGSGETKVQGMIEGHRYGNKVTQEDGSVTVDIFLPVSSLLRNYFNMMLEMEKIVELSHKHEESIAGLEKKATEMASGQKESERLLVEKSERLKEAQEKLALSLSLLEEKERQLYECKQELEKHTKSEMEKENLARMVLEKESKIEDLARNLQEKQGKIEEIDKVSLEKDKTIQQMRQELGEKMKALENAQNSLETLENRYEEQQKALSSFVNRQKQWERQLEDWKEKEKKLDDHEKVLKQLEALEDLATKLQRQELSLQQKLQSCYQECGRLTEERKEFGQEAEARMAEMEKRNQGLQANFQKMIDLISRYDEEKKMIQGKYEGILQQQSEMKSQLVQSKEREEGHQKMAEHWKKTAGEWEKRYYSLLDSYQNLAKPGDYKKQLSLIDEALKELYDNQSVLLGHLESILELLNKGK